MSRPTFKASEAIFNSLSVAVCGGINSILTAAAAIRTCRMFKIELQRAPKKHGLCRTFIALYLHRWVQRGIKFCCIRRSYAPRSLPVKPEPWVGFSRFHQMFIYVTQTSNYLSNIVGGVNIEPTLYWKGNIAKTIDNLKRKNLSSQSIAKLKQVWFQLCERLFKKKKVR